MSRKIGLGIALGAGAIAIMSGAAGAASTSRPVLLGRSNASTATTTLSNGRGTPLALRAKSGAAPFTVNSSAKVTNLNADKIDGLNSTQLQRPLAGECIAGQALSAINQAGAINCVPINQAEPDVTFTSHIASMTSGVGIAYCPTGSHPIGGGVVPDPTGATDLPFVVSDTVHITNGAYDGWEGIVGDNNGSYAGGGYVFVSCTSSTVTPQVTPAASVAQQRVNSLARIAKSQH